MPVAFTSANARRPRLQRRRPSPHQWSWSCGPLRSVNCCSSRLPPISIVPPTLLPYRRRQPQMCDDCLRDRSFRCWTHRIRSSWLAEGLHFCSPVNNEEQLDGNRSYVLILPHSPSWLSCLSMAHSANITTILQPIKLGIEWSMFA